MSTDIRTADNIADRAMEALWQDPFLDPTGLDLLVEDGVVTLLGADIAPANLAGAMALIEALPSVEAVIDATEQRLRKAA